VLAAMLGATSVVAWSAGFGQPTAAAATVSASAVPASGTAAGGSASGASASATTTPAGSAGTVQIPPPPAGTQTVANDGILRMDVNFGTGWFEVVDLRNGAVWTSGPSNPVTYAQNQLWQGILNSQFEMENTTIQRTTASNPQNQNNVQGYAQASLLVQRITNGMSMTYDFQTVAIQYTVDVTIQGAHMIATVPSTSIYEALDPSGNHHPLALGSPLGCEKFPQPKPTDLLSLYFFPKECYELTAISFLPAFGAGHPGQSGYVVVPDGSGAEIAFNKVHPIFTDRYNAHIYGNATVTPNADEWLPHANLPIYGIVHQDAQSPAQSSAMLAVVTQGQGNAKIQVVPAGQRANLYLADVKFEYRPQFNALGIGLTQQLQYQWKPVLGTRQVVYYFLDGSQANYSGIAARYRQYLIQTQHATPLKAPASGTPPLLLQVLNGIREVGVLFAPFERMTTFAQTGQMLQTLHSQGVKSVRVTLEGWMANGLQWKTLPRMWPPDGRLGGVGGLKKLTGQAHSLGDQVVLSVDMYHAYPGASGYNVRLDSLHTEDQLYLQDGGVVGSSFLLSPAYIQSTVFPALVKRLSSIGINGFDFNYFGRNLYPQLLKTAVTQRMQSAADLMSVVSSSKTKLGNAGVQGGNAYAIGPASYFYNAPLTDSGYNFETKSIPLWELVVHGLALYSGREANLLSSPTQDQLQMIEDGGLPAWELTWQSASDLRFTSYNELYTSSFAHWEAAAVAEYKQEVQTGYAQLAYVQMVGNQDVAPGVNVSDYANGAHVIVNFNSTPATVSQFNITVPADNYVVIPGGGSQ
jgi:hypothetical protein